MRLEVLGAHEAQLHRLKATPGAHEVPALRHHVLATVQGPQAPFTAATTGSRRADLDGFWRYSTTVFMDFYGFLVIYDNV